jgi:hypothetical protein
VSWSESLSNRVSIVIRRFIDNKKLVFNVTVFFIIFLHISLVLFCIVVYMVVCFVCFYLIFKITYPYCYVYVFLLLCVFLSRYSVVLCCAVYCL